MCQEDGGDGSIDTCGATLLCRTPRFGVERAEAAFEFRVGGVSSEVVVAVAVSLTCVAFFLFWKVVMMRINLS